MKIKKHDSKIQKRNKSNERKRKTKQEWQLNESQMKKAKGK